MILLLSKLETRYINSGTIIVDEMQENNEIYFVNYGKIGVGFEIQKETKYVIFFENGSVVGTYSVINNCRAEFIHRAFSNVKALAIRKEQWHSILDKSDNSQNELKEGLYRKAFKYYQENIKLPVMQAKQILIQKAMQRKDY